MAADKKHIIVCIENIDAEVQAELAMKADQEKSVTYTQIAERLADHYDLIYYINCVTLEYAELKEDDENYVLLKTAQELMQGRGSLEVFCNYLLT